jgi:hypothetical protein
LVIADSAVALRRNLATLSDPLVLAEREATEEMVRLQAVLDWFKPIPAGC